jgi:hypothetical protein
MSKKYKFSGNEEFRAIMQNLPYLATGDHSTVFIEFLDVANIKKDVVNIKKDVVNIKKDVVNIKKDVAGNVSTNTKIDTRNVANNCGLQTEGVRCLTGTKK